MKISTKGRYALRMLLDLAEHSGEGFISIKEISERQNISRKYLEQIVSLLNKAEFLQTNRGNMGGYKLVKKPAEYNLGEILRLTEKSLAVVDCTENPDICERSQTCLTFRVWKGLNRVVNEYVDNITLQDILDGKI